LNEGVRVASYPPLTGNQPSPTPRTVMSASPNQKCGMPRRKAPTGMTASSHVPRFQPATTPRKVPSPDPITVAIPSSATVHGRLWAMTCETGVGK